MTSYYSFDKLIPVLYIYITGVVVLFFSNIIGYDGIIVLLSIVNVLIIVLPVRNISSKVQKQLKKVVYLPIAELMDKLSNGEKKEPLDLNELIHLHQRSEKLYQMFSAVTSILPLLGIMGSLAEFPLRTTEKDKIRHFRGAAL